MPFETTTVVAIADVLELTCENLGCAEFVSESLQDSDCFPESLSRVGDNKTNKAFRKIIMSMTDPIADMLTRIRNANLRRSGEVSIPSSKIKRDIAEILKEEGFIEDWQLIESEQAFPEIKLQLKYLKDGQPVIRRIKRESKPGLRVFLKSNDAKPVLSGQGISILSTSKGVMSDRQCRMDKVGGELLCSVW